MSVLFWGLTLVALAFILHLILWRIHLPKRQTKVLLIVFFATLFAGCVMLWSSSGIVVMGVSAPQSWTEYLHIAIMFTAFTLAYMITYSGLEADSPTLVMVSAIHDAGPEGLAVSTFHETMTDDLLVLPRVRDLLTDKMATLENGRYLLTGKGRLMAHLFEKYRSLLKADKGG